MTQIIKRPQSPSKLFDTKAHYNSLIAYSLQPGHLPYDYDYQRLQLHYQTLILSDQRPGKTNPRSTILPPRDRIMLQSTYEWTIMTNSIDYTCHSNTTQTQSQSTVTTLVNSIHTRMMNSPSAPETIASQATCSQNHLGSQATHRTIVTIVLLIQHWQWSAASTSHIVLSLRTL